MGQGSRDCKRLRWAGGAWCRAWISGSVTRPSRKSVPSGLLPMWAKGQRLPMPLETELSRVLQELNADENTDFPLNAEAKSNWQKQVIKQFECHLVIKGRQMDFSDTQTDIWVSLVQLLNRSSLANHKAVLAQIANCPATLPNRALVRDAARVFVDGGKEPATIASAPLSHATRPVTPTSPSHVVLGQRGPNP